MTRLRLLALLGVAATGAMANAAPGLTTPWTSKVSQTLPHPEYPRPQLVRDNWVNLNGKWDLMIVPRNQVGRPQTKKVLVPFPVESQLSGVHEMVPAGANLLYKRTFTAPKGKGRVLLHFGAVDYACQVFVNGKLVGRHEGGYNGFSFDVTPYLKGSGVQNLTVHVQDDTDGPSWQPRGKQVRKPGGIFYTPTSGIWQTVWLERVPEQYVQSVYCDTALNGAVTVHTQLGGKPNAPFTIVAKAKGKVVATAQGKNGIAKFVVKNPTLWAPGSPFLYDLEVRVPASGDVVKSYFGVREVKVGKANGAIRILINGKPTFLAGPLDQGFWPDGLYTAPTDAAMKFDIDFTQKLGFNMIRKHVKVEPQRWYTYCDQMGIVVFQDMPSADHPKDPTQAKIASKRYEGELKEMIDSLRAHPSIVKWVVFNEGWGQYDTERIVPWVQRYDRTRLANNASGWTDKGVGDVIDAHIYPGPGSPDPEPKRAAVLGEFGGLGLITPGHMWQTEGWGYVSYKNQAQLTDAFVNLFRKLHYLIGKPGLSAAVYTQTTDVETESNGLLTYDRKVVKVDVARAREAILALYQPAPVSQEVLATSQKRASVWKYTTDLPYEGWLKPGFDDQTWATGEAGFGTNGTPGAVTRTVWNTPDLWVRREFTLDKTLKNVNLNLNIHHDEDVEVYIDGIPVARLQGYTSDYTLEPISRRMLPQLARGKHIIAAHVHQTTGGQYFDLGIVNLFPRKR